jgi:hypothetical protein
MDAVVAARLGPMTLADGWAGTVLAVFDRAVYLTPTGGDLLVVHDVGHGTTPTSVQIDVGRLGGWPCRPGDRAAGRVGHLRLGGLVVDLRHTPAWRPGAPVPPTCAPSPSATMTAGCRPDLLAHARAVLSGAPLRDLVGRGPGLTPAGDDALVGMLAVLHRATPPECAAPVLARLQRALPPLLDRTTPISAHYVRLALRGAFTEHLTAVVDALAAGGEPSDGQLERLLATGATSGADALAGVVAALTHLPTELGDVA